MGGAWAGDLLFDLPGIHFLIISNLFSLLVPAIQVGIQTSPALLQGWAYDPHLINHHFLSSWSRWLPLGWEYNPSQAKETQSWNFRWRYWERDCLFELRVAHCAAELSLELPRKVTWLEPAWERKQAREGKLAWDLWTYEHCWSLWTHMFSHTWTPPSLPLDFLSSYTSLEISYWSLSQFKWTTSKSWLLWKESFFSYRP